MKAQYMIIHPECLDSDLSLRTGVYTQDSLQRLQQALLRITEVQHDSSLAARTISENISPESILDFVEPDPKVVVLLGAYIGIGYPQCLDRARKVLEDNGFEVKYDPVGCMDDKPDLII